MVITEAGATKADVVLKAIERMALRESLPIIGPKRGKHLVDTMLEYHVRRILEIGTLIGYSAILMAQYLPDNGKVITIEIDGQAVQRAVENIRKAGLGGKIQVRPGDAIKVIPRLQGTFDMVFLDAAKEEYMDYLRLAEAKLKLGGIVFADNVKMFADRMQDYLKYVRESGRYRSRFVDAGEDGVEISIRLE